MPPSDIDEPYCRCIYGWDVTVRTEAMREYSDVAKHDIHRGRRLTDVFIRELVAHALDREDMDNG